MAFETTNWDLVDDLSDKSDDKRHKALSELTNRTWKPVYVYLRAQGYSVDHADELTQGFFCHVIEKELMNRANKDKGKFRSFIIGVLKKFCSDVKDYKNAQKRSPQERLISLESIEGVENYLSSHLEEDPQKIFLRTWAQNLLERILHKLKEESEVYNKPHFYDLIHKLYFQQTSQKTSYKELANQHGLTLDQIGNDLRTAKNLYSNILRDEISQTIGNQSDVDQEIREIIAILQNK